MRNIILWEVIQSTLRSALEKLARQPVCDGRTMFLSQQPTSLSIIYQELNNLYMRRWGDCYASTPRTSDGTYLSTRAQELAVRLRFVLR